jgi:hypothetical protein
MADTLPMYHHFPQQHLAHHSYHHHHGENHPWFWVFTIGLLIIQFGLYARFTSLVIGSDPDHRSPSRIARLHSHFHHKYENNWPPVITLEQQDKKHPPQNMDMPLSNDSEDSTSTDTDQEDQDSATFSQDDERDKTTSIDNDEESKEQEGAQKKYPDMPWEDFQAV